jgi:hypothetical protein
MAFAQLTYRDGLRDIEACLRSLGGKLYHMGFSRPGDVLIASSGYQALQLPSAPADADLQSATRWFGSLKTSMASLQMIADALGGCGSK